MATDPEDRPLPDQTPGAPHPSETPILYGQDRAEAAFLEAFNSGRLHSGWLISGPRGVGKATLAWKIAGFLLSQREEQGGGLFGDAPPATDALTLPADHPDARLIASGAHPRLFVLRRAWDEKADRLKTQITVDEVRRLKGFFSMSAADGGRRVVIIDPADEMNVSAANAILKILEEPPSGATLLLIAHQPSRLLPTIRSRCRVLRCEQLAPPALASALEQAGTQVTAADALAELSTGSAGEALRLINLDGLKTYAELIAIAETLPRTDRARLVKLADSCAGKGAEARFDLVLDLIDRMLSRLARAGLEGAPATQAAPGEARLLARLSPHDHAARAWADLAQDVSDRTRRGRAVNLDPAALILDTFFRIEATARKAAA